MKNLLIISTSLRVGSNSDILALECVRGAKDAGNNVEYVNLHNKTINFCKGCLACQKTQNCVIKDDANEITEKVKHSDVIVFVTPIYYYEMSGQLKTLLDRMNPLYSSNYKFREVYMIATAADSSNEAFDRAYAGLNGWVECFPKASLKRIVRGAGINDPKDAVNHKAILKEAYFLGNNIL